MLRWLKRRRRRALRERPIPHAWTEIVRARVPYVADLGDADRAELWGHMHVFLGEKRFEGCGGLVLTEEIRVTIAAQACLLLLHRDTDYFPHCDSILVYPHPFRSPERSVDAAGIVSETREVRVGESWRRGLVVLAWDNVLRGARDVHDGQNVVLHEFAHQLDEESGRANGTPRLSSRASYRAWARVMTPEYEALIEATLQHHRSDIDAYGATSPAEFFAVLTEMFFEQPTTLVQRHPGLYRALAEFYRQDPARRVDPER